MSVLPIDITLDWRAGDRGLYRLVGKVDATAPNLQILKTPNGTPMTIAAFQADGYPRIWSIQQTLEAAPADAPSWEETTNRILKQIGVNTDLNTLPAEDTKSAVQVFSEGVADSIKKGADAVGISLTVVVVAFFLLLLTVVIVELKK